MKYFVLVIAAIFAPAFAPADTFTDTATGKTYHGFAVQRKIGPKTLVQTLEAGPQYLDLAKIQRTYSIEGRKDTAIVFKITDIDLQCQAKTFIDALTIAGNSGCRCIIIHIDSPGGIADLAMQMCEAIRKTSAVCPVYAFIGGPEYQGAFSAGMFIAISCDRIYMSPGSATGAAAAIAITDKGVQELNAVHGETMGAKIKSKICAGAVALAEATGRPAALVRAMIDKDFECCEYAANGRSVFCQASEVPEGATVIKNWNEKGSLLSLTADDAVKVGFADGIAASPADLLSALGLQSTRLAVNDKPEKMRKQFESAKQKYINLLSENEQFVAYVNTDAADVAKTRRAAQNEEDVLDDMRRISRNNRDARGSNARFRLTNGDVRSSGYQKDRVRDAQASENEAYNTFAQSLNGLIGNCNDILALAKKWPDLGIDKVKYEKLRSDASTRLSNL